MVLEGRNTGIYMINATLAEIFLCGFFSQSKGLSRRRFSKESAEMA